MNYQQKQSSFWWTSNLRTIIYFVRELTGVFITFYTIYFLVSAYFDPNMSFITQTPFKIISYIGFSAAIIHTITWFWVSVKISPIPLGKLASTAAFIFLLIACGAASYFLFMNLYV